LEKLRHLVHSQHLLLQEEARPVAIAVFGKPSLIVHLGFDQAQLAAPDWYQQSSHPYVQAIAQILDDLSEWPQMGRLEFLVSPGIDPLTSLQVQLDRQTFPLTQRPSSICDNLTTQKIYSFER
jgi:3,4-dihydroxy 2-butanone 4-phosphate synthase/GTP cyclohydrolase II